MRKSLTTVLLFVVVALPATSLRARSSSPREPRTGVTAARDHSQLPVKQPPHKRLFDRLLKALEDLPVPPRP